MYKKSSCTHSVRNVYKALLGSAIHNRKKDYLTPNIQPWKSGHVHTLWYIHTMVWYTTDKISDLQQCVAVRRTRDSIKLNLKSF